MKWKHLLLATILVVSCVDNPPEDPTDRYRGSISPCEVVVDGSHEPYEPGDFVPVLDPDPRDASPPMYWLPGPFPTWNTTPATHCSQDPTIPEVTDDAGEETLRDVAMYITYPSRSIPTQSGDGRLAEGSFPVIVFAHANHDRKCNIFRGYYSLHDHWASWGFVVVAVDGTATNCRPGNRQNIELRLRGQLAAIDALRGLNENPDSRFYQRLDLERVVFAGHSRGGGASLEAARRHGNTPGVIDIQGIDLTAFGFGNTTLPDFPVVAFTAGNDVDLDYPLVEPTEDQLGGPYTWVNINGGIHAYTADSAPLEPDDEPAISREQQHAITQYYSTAFLARTVGLPEPAGELHRQEELAERVLFSHEGARIVVDDISKKGVFTRWRSGRMAVAIDDFDGANAINPPEVNLLGGANESNGLTASAEVPTYRPDQSSAGGLWGKSYSRRLESDGSGEFRTFMAADEAPLDVSSEWTLVARVKGPDEGNTASFEVEIETENGSSRVDGTKFLGPVELRNRFTQLRIPLSEFGSSETFEIVSIAIHPGAGTLFVDDLRFVEASEAALSE